jgi:hypothetical protein
MSILVSVQDPNVNSSLCSGSDLDHHELDGLPSFKADAA